MEDSESCSSPHRLHEWFQICKYVYHDVIRLQDIQKHLDCSKIQTYKINGEKAIHLHPRPPSKDIKIAKLVKAGALCEACGRHLQDLPNCFCSIQCKVSIMEIFKEQDNSEKITFPNSKFDDTSLKHDAENEDQPIISKSQSSIWWKSTLKPNKELHLHKRKGVPHRAPLL
ncbi:OLC1v1033030C2 [Oldenlandia corymbosa var. corymbosa]|nr:OLC1v1033030C2 [Oldenlandia corymbosa var. corymbosa]